MLGFRPSCWHSPFGRLYWRGLCSILGGLGLLGSFFLLFLALDCFMFVWWGGVGLFW